MDSELFTQLAIIFIDLVLGVLISIRLSKGKSKKRNMIWGIVTMFIIAPLVSVVLSFSIGLIVDDGWVAIAIMFIIFPLFFFVGIGRLVIGMIGNKTNQVA